MATWRRRRTVSAVLTAVAALAIAVPACSSSGDEDGVASALTAWDRELYNVAPDGSRSLDSALRLFAIALGPIPGVEAPTTPHGLIDASTAVYEIAAHRTELTPEQQTAVDAALRPPADAITAQIAPDGSVATDAPASGGGGRRRLVAPQPPLNPQIVSAYSQTVGLARNRLAARLGYNYPGDTIVTFASAGGDYAWADGRWSNGAMTACDIRFDPVKGTSAANVVNTLFHETLHCFQHALFPDVAASRAAYVSAKWAWEGSSEWAAAELVGADEDTPKRWTTYLKLPQRSLFQRSYDAIGFFAHLEESGITPWSKLRAMWTAGGNAAAFSVSGAGATAFLESWASSYFRDRQLGRAWDTTGPGISSDRGPFKSIRVANRTKTKRAAGPYTNGLYVLNLQADVLQVDSIGYTRIANGKLDRVLGRAVFCTREDGKCACPGRKSSLEPLAGNPSLALTGGPTGATVTISGKKFDEKDCERRRERGKNLGVVVTRPAYSQDELVIDELDVMEFAACDGIHGRWAGVLRTGGYHLVPSVNAPVVEVPVEFTVDARGHAEVHTRLPAAIDLTVRESVTDVSVDLTINVHGRRMDIIGNYFADLNPTNLPIERVAGVRC